MRWKRQSLWLGEFNESTTWSLLDGFLVSSWTVWLCFLFQFCFQNLKLWSLNVSIALIDFRCITDIMKTLFCPLSYKTRSLDKHEGRMLNSSICRQQVTRLLKKMQLHAVKSDSADNQCKISVSVPPTRSDILHPCDVMEVYS